MALWFKWTMPTPWTGPLIRGPLCWRGSANKWFSHSVIIGHRCLQWAYDLLCYETPPTHPQISSWRILNDCTTLALTGLICTKRRRVGGGEGGRKKGREGAGEEEREKESEWHHNITMHLEAQLANTAGPATVKRLMSHNSKETEGYWNHFYYIGVFL